MEILRPKSRQNSVESELRPSTCSNINWLNNGLLRLDSLKLSVPQASLRRKLQSNKVKVDKLEESFSEVNQTVLSFSYNEVCLVENHIAGGVNTLKDIAIRLYQLNKTLPKVDFWFKYNAKGQTHIVRLLIRYFIFLLRYVTNSKLNRHNNKSPFILTGLEASDYQKFVTNLSEACLGQGLPLPLVLNMVDAMEKTKNLTFKLDYSDGIWDIDFGFKSPWVVLPFPIKHSS